MRFLQRWKQTSLPNKLLVVASGLMALGTLFYAGVAVFQYGMMREQADTTKGQLNSMQEQSKVMQRQLDTLQDQASSMRQQTEALRSSLDETRTLVRQNERAVKAAEQSANVARESFRLGERAYIEIKDIRISKIVVGENPNLAVTLVNRGRTPAWNVRLLARLDIATADLDRPTTSIDFRFPQSIHGGFMPAGTEYVLLIRGIELNLSSGDYPFLNLGALKLFVTGKIEYTEVQGTKQVLPFCAVYLPPSDQFAFCP